VSPLFTSHFGIGWPGGTEGGAREQKQKEKLLYFTGDTGDSIQNQELRMGMSVTASPLALLIPG